MKRLRVLMFLLLCSLAMASTALGSEGDRVAIGSDVEVRAGETVRGDVVVLGGNATIEGRVHGDVVVLGGDLRLGSAARVDGDLAHGGGELSKAEGARVGGSVVGVAESGVSPEQLVGKLDGSSVSVGGGGGSVIEHSNSPRDGRSSDSARSLGAFIAELGTSLLASALLLVLGLLFMSISPERSRNLRRTLEASPWASLFMGALISLGLGLISFLLTITVVGVLALPLLFTVCLAVWLVGITALLEALGDRLPLPERFRSRGSDFIAGVAVFAVLGLFWTIGGLVAAVAALLTLGMGFMAVGAAVLSGLGRAPYGRV